MSIMIYEEEPSRLSYNVGLLFIYFL